MQVINTATFDLSNLSPDESHWIYNGLDCVVTADIFENLYAQVDEVCLSTYQFSLDLQAPVLEMSMRGLLVNKRKKSAVIREMQKKLAQLEANFNRILFEVLDLKNFNWRSPLQLNNLFYNILKVPVQKKRKSGGGYGPSTDREALEALTIYFIAEPLCNHLLAMRDLGKSISFFQTATDPDGRMRTQFNISGTKTGRWSSNLTDFGTGTNLQNVNSALRSVFVSDPGYKFANLDLEQADSRNVGALCWNAFSEDPNWTERSAGAYLDACESGDLHTTVCRMAMTHLDWDKGLSDREVANQISYRGKTYRDNSKVLGHGSNYLGQPVTMAKHSKLPVQLVKEFHVNYFSAFPCIPEWHKKVFWMIENMGYLITPFGRRRYFFDRPREASTRREAVANDPQSMTAEEINIGILKLWRANRVQLLLQVHDSILFQYREEEEDEIIPWALETLKTRLVLAKGREFVVPTEAMTGWNWGYYSPDNLDGLKKWKGADTRSRTEIQFKLSLLDR